MAYNKYLALYTVTANDYENGEYVNFSLRIISLGKLKTPLKPVAIPNTYAYKIFSSELELEEVCKNFIGSQEDLNSVCFYIGKKFSATDYKKFFPNFKFSAEISSSLVSLSVAKVFPLDSDITLPVVYSNYSRAKVISPSEATNTLELVSIDTLRENYKQQIIY